jgi:DinB superfamily
MTLSHDDHGGGCHEHSDSCCKGQAHKASGQCCQDQAVATAQAATPADFEVMDEVALVMRYRRGIEHIDRRLFDLTEEQLDTAFLPEANVGRWPVRVLIGHLADADLVFSHRMRRIVGEDRPVLGLFDEDSFVDSMIYGNGPKKYAQEPEADHARVMSALGGPLAVVHTLRQWTGQWLLNLAPQQWGRIALHPEKGEQTIKRILAYTTWHLEHHARFLTQKLDKMLGPAPAEEPSGGCGPGCGCGH